VGTKPVELLSTDAFHLLKVFDFSKWSTCRPVIDHPLRQLGADTGQACKSDAVAWLRSTCRAASR
jgi:hypothetical protein